MVGCGVGLLLQKRLIKELVVCLAQGRTSAIVHSTGSLEASRSTCTMNAEDHGSRG